ncbi:MAG: hypothetical protein JWQ41_2278 [Variovorax sp.]|nr:hypothetical protein [Variovorax sp.]
MLLETAIATTLLGVMIVAVVTTARKATNDLETRHTVSETERAENALQGYAKVNSHLPVPDEAMASPSRPGYVEGWLPVAALDMQGLSSRIRYVVAQPLTVIPAIYRADPANLSDGKVDVRTTVNGLDLCAALMRREQAGDALPGGMRLGYALQQAISMESGQPLVLAQSWLGDTASSATPSNVRLDTRTRGFGEFAVSLGCFARFATLSREVRSIAATADMRRLADQELALRKLNRSMGEDSLTNLRWRMANWTVGTAKLSVDLGMEAVSAITAVETTSAEIANIASLTATIAGLSWLLQKTGDGIVKGEKSNDAGDEAIKAAQASRDQLQQEVQRYALRANQLQKKGLEQ